MINHKNLLITLNDLKVKGLYHFMVLNTFQKNFILHHEELRNKGVRETLTRTYTVASVHDDSLRKPARAIVKKTKGTISFPAVPFPEFTRLKLGKRFALRIVSSSPGEQIHEYLRLVYKKKRIRLKNEEATLLIGFD